jgi:hypothetical protein
MELALDCLFVGFFVGVGIEIGKIVIKYIRKFIFSSDQL